MQRRLTIALVSTALVSILLVGFGVLAMAQFSAQGNAERDVNRGLNVLTDFLDGPNRSPRQVEGLLFGSRGNIGLDLLERVTIDADGKVRALDETRRRGAGAGGDSGGGVDGAGVEGAGDNGGDISQPFPKLTLNDDQVDALETGKTVFASSGGRVNGLRVVTFEAGNGEFSRSVTVLATKRVTAVTRQTFAWFLLSSLIVLAGALLAGIWLAKRFAGPIKEIQSATAAIAAGDLSARVEPTGTDEVADLGHEVNRMAADLERSKALDRQFLMSVSHDLRTPLTAITGYAEGLTDGAVTDPRAAGEVIGSHAARLDRLVGDLLDLARLDANRFRLNMRPFDLAVLAGRSVAELSNHALKHGIALVRGGLDSATVDADPDRAAQAIGNLIDNAIKFANSSISITIERQGKMAVVAIHDDGPGIPPQDLPHIFDRLYTGKAQPDRAENPTGLGLAIVRELAAAMGGTVSADNHPDGGALLSLALPLSEPIPGAQTPSSPSVSQAPSAT